jgi:hypothetical protein
MGGLGGKCVERVVGTLSDRALGDAKHLGHLAVALATVEHEREHGTLVGWESI